MSRCPVLPPRVPGDSVAWLLHGLLLPHSALLLHPTSRALTFRPGPLAHFSHLCHRRIVHDLSINQALNTQVTTLAATPGVSFAHHQ